MIKKNFKFKVSPSYKNLGPWIINYHELFDDDVENLDDTSYKILTKLIKELRSHPYEGTFQQHPLWQFYDTEGDSVIWSAVITDDLRLTYQIYKRHNIIELLSVGNHKVLNYKYSK